MDAVPSDLDLIRRTKGGDQKAFDELIRRYGRRTYQVVYGLVRNHADTEDLLQETFLRAYENISRFDERYRFYTWLYRIAVNLCFTFLRRRKSAPVSYRDATPEATDDDAEFDPPDERGPELAEHSDQRRNVERALAQLPPEQRLALTLRTYHDLSYAEIAEVMQTSIGTVMSRLSRAREKMRMLLTDYVKGN